MLALAPETGQAGDLEFIVFSSYCNPFSLDSNSTVAERIPLKNNVRNCLKLLQFCTYPAFNAGQCGR